MSQLTPSTASIRTFEDHEGTVWVVVVFPDKRRMVTCSSDKTLCLRNLETGIVLRKMEGHSSWAQALAVSRDGQIIASGDYGRERHRTPFIRPFTVVKQPQAPSPIPSPTKSYLTIYVLHQQDVAQYPTTHIVNLIRAVTI
ncbi:hypothetical protein BDR07DRAFT_1422354 [Suillus spraguei]|nr:hypothetical protein BDR07DRAFT_1422354 [Suillus spraguei]